MTDQRRPAVPSITNAPARTNRRAWLAGALSTSALAIASAKTFLAGQDGDGADRETGTVRIVNGGVGASNSVVQTVAAPTNADFQALRARQRTMLTGGAGFSPSAPPFAAMIQGIDDEVAGHLATLNTAANRTYLWNDPASGANSANMTASFGRLRLMAIQYATLGSAYNGNSSFLSTIVSALQWLSDNRYYPGTGKPNNWWDWEIGSPLALLDALVVLDANVPAALKASLLATVDSYTPVAGTGTAANRTWYTRVVLLRAILVEDGAKFDEALASLLGLMANTTSGDGFYADGSFIQHSRHPYNGGYGVGMFNQLAWMVCLLGGGTTTWIQPADWAIMIAWTWSAFEPLLFRGALSGAVSGRNVSRDYYTDHYAGASALASIALLTAVAASADIAALKSFFKTLVTADTVRNFFAYDPTTGLGSLTLYIVTLGWAMRNDAAIATRAEINATIVYPQMDRLVHRKPGWSFVVANSSSRIYNYEGVNGENLRGWYTGDGMVYFLNGSKLDHFQDDYWPTVDHYRLPGTTVDKRTLVNNAGQSTLSPSAMVGGVSDLNCGVGVMTVDRWQGTAKARKSWIFVGDYVVCQGSGITNTSSSEVETIIDNRNIGAAGTNAVRMNSAANTVLTGFETPQTLAATWLHVDGVGGYLFQGTNPPIKGLRTSRSYKWTAINLRPSTPADIRTRRYLTFWFEHGTAPTNDTYGYVFLPNATASATETASTANQIQRQATTAAHYAYANFSTLDVYGAVFWQTASIGVFTANAAVAVIVRATSTAITITLSDPTQARTSAITVTVALPNTGVSSTHPATTVSRTASSATITFNPSGMKGAGARVVLTP